MIYEVVRAVGDAFVEADGVVDRRQRIGDFRDRALQELRDLFRGCVFSLVSAEVPRRQLHLSLGFVNVIRHVHCRDLRTYDSSKAAPDDGAGKRCERESAKRIEALDGTHERDVTFLNQISEMYAAVLEPFRNRDHQSKVRFAPREELFTAKASG